MRPLYETDSDRARESDVFEYIKSKIDCDVVKAPENAHFDGFLVGPNNLPMAMVEVKNRNNASTKYPTYMLSANKCRKCKELSDSSGVPFVLVVRFTDGVFALTVKGEYPVEMGGRYDRNDPRDKEPCMFIPMDKFHKV
eukprot:GHVR01144332.1.p2 GENE.GHVR01144332.1~~GHVR01144332.1.p2  ORF type:complete len:139 (-),score=5.76 GHVR01144332.1:6-422(-)